MRDLVVYGASGFGQQVMFWVEDANAADPRFNVLGFVDDDSSAHGEVRTGQPVLGGEEWLVDRARSGRVAVVMGLAGPSVKQSVVSRVEGLAAEFPVVVHPSAVVSRHARLARGALIGPGNVVSVNVSVEEFATVNTSCTLGHDALLGAYATLLPGVNVSGKVVVGGGVSVGTGAAITQEVEIGEQATVGAGATVLGDLPAGCTAVGTPARPL
jgi:sugar O-acyltransferase (sialic acid O-acetyltransferase NeuD family)